MDIGDITYNILLYPVSDAEKTVFWFAQGKRCEEFSYYVKACRKVDKLLEEEKAIEFLLNFAKGKI